MKSNNYSPLFRLSCKVLKYFLLSLVGFVAACSIAALLGALPTVTWVMNSLAEWWLRLGGLTVCFLTFAALLESFRE